MKRKLFAAFVMILSLAFSSSTLALTPETDEEDGVISPMSVLSVDCWLSGSGSSYTAWATATSSVTETITVMYCGQMVETAQREQLLVEPHHPYTHALLNTIPDFSGRLPHKSRLNALPGVIPPLQHLPIGCRLGPRCPYAQKLCVQTPPVTRLKNQHFSCHFPLNMEESKR